MTPQDTRYKRRQDTVRYNWGIRFAFWCSLLWATFYVGLEFLIADDGFMGASRAARNPLDAAMAITLFVSIGVCVICVIWMAATGRLMDYIRAMSGFKAENKTILACSACGAVSCLASYVVMLTSTSTFAVCMVMFYPLVGALLSQVFNKERVGITCAAGIVVIVVGCTVLYLPALFADGVANTALMCCMGLIAGFGWGAEACLSSRASDTLDPEVADAVRYAYEAIIWVVVVLLFWLFAPGTQVTAYASSLIASPAHMVPLLLVTFCFTFNGFSWYKSFALCGVARGTAMSDLSGLVSIVLGLLFATSTPGYSETLACILMGIGVLVVYDRRHRSMPNIRDVDIRPTDATVHRVRSFDGLGTKARAILFVATDGPKWDYEVASRLAQRGAAGGEGKYDGALYRRVRMYLIEAEAAGIVVSIEHDIGQDSGHETGVLCGRYVLTEYGRAQLLRLGIVKEGARPNAQEARQGGAL